MMTGAAIAEAPAPEFKKNILTVTTTPNTYLIAGEYERYLTKNFAIGAKLGVIGIFYGVDFYISPSITVDFGMFFINGALNLKPIWHRYQAKKGFESSEKSRDKQFKLKLLLMQLRVPGLDQSFI